MYSETQKDTHQYTLVDELLQSTMLKKHGRSQLYTNHSIGMTLTMPVGREHQQWFPLKKTTAVLKISNLPQIHTSRLVL